MGKKITTVAVCAVGAAFFFLAGMFVGPKGTNLKSKMKGWKYTRTAAQKLYERWDEDSLFFGNGGESLKSFSEKNGAFILYNWATWCPHCKNINQKLQRLEKASIPTIALTFDTDHDSYKLYREKTSPFWRDLFMRDESGKDKFVPRENEFDVPLIPSLWIVENGSVQKIFVGEAGADKIFSYLEKRGFIGKD